MYLHSAADFVKRHLLVCLAAVFFVVLFAAFFPGFYASIDEHEYLKNASLLVQGKVVNASPLDYCGGIKDELNYRSTYYLGKSVFLVPFLPFGLNGAMLSGLLIHLLNATILFLIFRRLKIDARFVLLYLFFPAFVWNGRTLNPELLVLTAALAGTFFFLGGKEGKGFWSKSDVWSGFFFGLAALVRFDQVILFAGYALVRLKEDRKRFLSLPLSLLVVVSFILAINSAFYGGPLNRPTGRNVVSYYLVGQNEYTYPFYGFTVSSLVANLAVWVGIFLVAYPLMLLSPAFVLWFNRRRESKMERSGFFSFLEEKSKNDLKKISIAAFISAIPLFYVFSQWTGV